MLSLAIIFVAATAFVVGAMVWLRRLRAQVATAVSEALTRQIEHGKRVEEALSILQKNQKKMEEQVLLLGEAYAKARTDINILAQQRGAVNEPQPLLSRMLH
jgi:hypothetical protein